jgi:hypothetical protein
VSVRRSARAFSLVFTVHTWIGSTWAAQVDRSLWVPFLPPHHRPRSRDNIVLGNQVHGWLASMATSQPLPSQVRETCELGKQRTLIYRDREVWLLMHASKSDFWYFSTIYLCTLNRSNSAMKSSSARRSHHNLQAGAGRQESQHPDRSREHRYLA